MRLKSMFVVPLTSHSYLLAQDDTPCRIPEPIACLALADASIFGQ